jgi:hypothetical protein
VARRIPVAGGSAARCSREVAREESWHVACFAIALVRWGVISGTFVAALVLATSTPALATTHPRVVDPCKVVHATEVVGRVVDAAGHAIAGASVIASPATTTGDGRTSKTVVSDRFGRFRLIGLPPGEYWFIGIHGDHPFGITPAMPVVDRLEVAITLDLAVFAI